MPKTRVLLADDHTLFRDGLASLLTAWDMEVVGQASNGVEAVAQARRLKPELVIMDIHMPKMDGLEATRIIKTDMPETTVVILTVSDNEDSLFEAVKSGAQGYILKNIPGDEFGRLLANLAQGEPAMSKGLAKRVLEEFARYGAEHEGKDSDVSEPLTTREQEVLEQVAEGHTNKEIASLLFISDETVKYHIKNIMQKLHLRNRAEVVAWAIRHHQDRRES
ncbi:MAG: two component transcriptional regulator, LuxR family [Dehalococcoidia bacterium]|nr:two component transcriptional regulator, LuxR family [Dehalococcoidia bacterium]